MKDGKRAYYKETYNCCSLASFLTCIIDFEDFVAVSLMTP
jgi:hypothetical protein